MTRAAGWPTGRPAHPPLHPDAPMPLRFQMRVKPMKRMVTLAGRQMACVVKEAALASPGPSSDPRSAPAAVESGGGSAPAAPYAGRPPCT